MLALFAGWMKPDPMSRKPRRLIWTVFITSLALLALFVAAAYFALPFFWRHHESEPGLAGIEMRTRTAQNIPGDPINIGMTGAQEDVRAAFQRIGWSAADALSIKDDLKIANSVILHKRYDSAPVSNLYYQGRAQDLAFELPVGSSADQRHHVRFWKVLDVGSDGEPLWLGAVSFDKGVGLSHFTGQITHHIDADLDKERDALISQLSAAGLVSRLFQVSGVGPTVNGRNGGGDRFFTDGEVTIAALDLAPAPGGRTVEMTENPPMVRLKQSIWDAFAP
jgi:LssY C-terminus